MTRLRPFYVNLLFVALGGALGSVCRYATSLLVYRYVGPGFPAGTFVVNVAGCVIFGLLAGLAQPRSALGPEARAFLFVGVLGGFTTFSTFAFETVELLRTAQPFWAFLNVAGQMLAGLMGLWAGLTLAGRL